MADTAQLTEKSPLNAYGAPLSYQPASPAPEMRELLLELMRTRKTIRFDVMESRKAFGGYSRAMPIGQQRPTVGPFLVPAMDTFVHRGKQHDVFFNTKGLPLFDNIPKDSTRDAYIQHQNSDQSTIGENLTFENGPIILDVNRSFDMLRAEFLLHSSLCVSFPFRRDQVTPQFELYNYMRDRTNAKVLRVAEAELTVILARSTMDIEPLRQKLQKMMHRCNYRAPGFDSAGVYDVEAIKEMIEKVGSQFPEECLEVMRDQDDKYRSMATQAAALDVIRFNEQTRFWEHLQNGRPFTENEIVRAEHGSDAFDTLIIFLKQNESHARRIREGVLAKAK